MADRDLSVAMIVSLVNRFSKPAEEMRRDLAQIRGAIDKLDDSRGADGLRRDLAAIGRAANRTEAEIKDIDAAAAQLGAIAGSGRLGRALGDVGTSADRAERQVDELRTALVNVGGSTAANRAMATLGDVAGAADRAERQVDELRTALVNVGSGTGTARAAAALADVAGAADRATREVNDVRAAIVNVGGAGTATTVRGIGGVASAADRATLRVDALRAAIGAAGDAGGAERLVQQLAAVERATERAERRLVEARAAAGAVGTAGGAARLERALRGAGRSADLAERRLDRLRTTAARLGDGAGSAELERAVAAIGRSADRSANQIGRIRGAAERVALSSGFRQLTRAIGDAEGAARRAEAQIDRIHAAASRRVAAGGVRAELDAILRVAGRAERQVEELRAVVGRAGSASGPDRLRQAIDEVATAADQAERQVEELKAAADKLGTSTGASAFASDIDRANRRVSDLHANADARQTLIAAGRRPGSAVAEAGREAAATMGGGFIPVLGGPAVMTGAAVGGGAFAGVQGARWSFRQSMSMDETMGEVQKATGLEGADLEAMKRTILDVSRRKAPLSKEEIGQLVAQAGFAGRPVEELPDFALFAGKAAAAFTLPAEQTGEALAKVGNIFGLDQKGIEAVADAINYLADNNSASEGDLLNFLMRGGQTGALLGMSGQTVAGFGTGLLASGVQPEIAATTFNTIGGSLANARSKWDKDEEKEALKELGLTISTIEKSMLQDTGATVADFLNRVAALQKERQFPVLSELFGQEYADNVAASVLAANKISGNIAGANDPATAGGSVDRSYEVKQALLVSRLDMLSNATDAAGVMLGDRFAPALGRVADWMAGHINAWTDEAQRQKLAESIAGKQSEGRELAAAELRALVGDPKLAAAADALTGRKLGGAVEAKRGGDAGLTTGEAVEAARALAEAEARAAELNGRIAEIRRTSKLPEIAETLAAPIRAEIEVLRQAIEDYQALLARPRVLPPEAPPAPPVPSAQQARIEKAITEMAAARAALTMLVSPADREKMSAEAARLKEELIKTLRAPEISDAARETMRRYADTLGGEGARATAEARAIAEELRSILDITLVPQIAPRVGEVPVPRAKKIDYAPPAAPAAGIAAPAQRQAAASSGPTTFTLVQHINGAGDPKKVARASARESDRVLRRVLAGSLHDTGSVA